MITHRGYLVRPSGEVFVELGVGRVREARPTPADHQLLELTLDVPGRIQPMVAVADRRAEPFRTLFAHGHLMWVVKNNLNDFEYRYEIRRAEGVNPAARLVDLSRAQKRRVLVDLRPASAVPVPRPYAQRAG